MSDLPIRLEDMNFVGCTEHNPQKELLDSIQKEIESAGYNVIESNTTKPWGAYFRIDSSESQEFLDDFFPGLSIEEAQLGIEGAELSPKILVVLPGQRLSWQYHDRRAERWRFLTSGGYRRSVNNTESERHEAELGEVVQFSCGERHRLEGMSENVTVVAEIWQHAEPEHPSDEDDIIRVADDYVR